MNETCCYYRLNIDTSGALKSTWKMPEPKGNYGIWYPSAKEIFSDNWLEYTKNLGIDFKHALLFYRGPNTTSKEAHVDTHATSHKFVNFAINWVIGGRESSMHWYKLPDMKVASVVKDPTTSVPYTTFQFKDLEPIESCSISDQITLVKTEIPHSITMGSDPRWCISARIADDKMTWEEVVQYLRSKKILVERT